MGPEEAPALPVLLGDTEVVANTEALRLVETGGDGLGAWLAVHLIVDVQGETGTHNVSSMTQR